MKVRYLAYGIEKRSEYRPWCNLCGWGSASKPFTSHREAELALQRHRRTAGHKRLAERHGDFRNGSTPYWMPDPERKPSPEVGE